MIPIDIQIAKGNNEYAGWDFRNLAQLSMFAREWALVDVPFSNFFKCELLVVIYCVLDADTASILHETSKVGIAIPEPEMFWLLQGARGKIRTQVCLLPDRSPTLLWKPLRNSLLIQIGFPKPQGCLYKSKQVCSSRCENRKWTCSHVTLQLCLVAVLAQLLTLNIQWKLFAVLCPDSGR